MRSHVKVKCSEYKTNLALATQLKILDVILFSFVCGRYLKLTQNLEVFSVSRSESPKVLHEFLWNLVLGV
jgi:hypothetical protein